ncbi:MAG: ABC transporter substrate-binding protein [Proteobacteria bacterium]|jgi:phospholipid transport system substrate-binding protein|nr:ABC transporter substrate-binding protein [Pseudomonadota bacterium]
MKMAILALMMGMTGFVSAADTTCPKELALAGGADSEVAAGPVFSDSPAETVRGATDQLLAKLLVITPLYRCDKELFFERVSSSISPYIDFDGFARGVMAKYYRLASEQQIKAFAGEFRLGLIRTYSSALVEFDNQKVVVSGSEISDRSPDRATVSVEVHGKDGTVYPVEYSMAKVDGQWQVRNVVINGINMGLQFRSQFSAYMQKYGNDIGQVIANWRVDE